jgi:hypothetical protein
MREPYLHSWAVRMSRAESLDALDHLMNDWYDGVKADRGLNAAVGFGQNMERRDWNAAKSSVERAHGRSSREHQATLDTLAAAILCKRILSHRLVQ